MASKAPFQYKVSAKYGAPMGRASDLLADLTGKVHLRQVKLVDGDYDEGGAYWGGGPGVQPLFCLWDDEGHVVYTRANSREGAKAWLTSVNRSVTFYQ